MTAQIEGFWKIMKCPGCPKGIIDGDLCCGDCYERIPIALPGTGIWRKKLDRKHKKSDWPHFEAIHNAVVKWLNDHPVPIVVVYGDGYQAAFVEGRDLIDGYTLIDGVLNPDPRAR